MFDSTACGRSRVVIARRSVSALRGVPGVVGSVLVGGLVRRRCVRARRALSSSLTEYSGGCLVFVLTLALMKGIRLVFESFGTKFWIIALEVGGTSSAILLVLSQSGKVAQI